MPCQCKTDRQKSRCVWYIPPDIGLIEEDPIGGQVRVVSGCFPQIMLRWMTGVVKTNTSCAAAMESARNHFAGAVTQLFGISGLLQSGGQINEPARLSRQINDDESNDAV